MGDTVPRVKTIHEEPNRDAPGHVTVQITCPYCGERHQHGIELSERESPRSAHCVRDAPAAGYIVVRRGE